MQNQNFFPQNFSFSLNILLNNRNLKNYCLPSSIGSTTDPSFFAHPNPITNWLFTFVVKGQYHFSNGLEPTLNITCKENTLLLINPGEYFVVEGAAEECQRIWMHISGDMIPEIIKDLNLSGVRTVTFSKSDAISILNSFNSLRNAILLRKINSVLIISRSLSFLDQFDCNAKIENQTVLNSLEKSLDYINENFNKKISVKFLAEKSNMSEAYFIRNFKKKYELTPYQLIMSLRFSNAVHYLKNTNKSIEEISELCGFNDRINFSSAFTKQLGVSPQKYRNQCNND